MGQDADRRRLLKSRAPLLTKLFPVPWDVVTVVTSNDTSELHGGEGPTVPIVWTRKRRENTCPAGDRTAIVQPHRQSIYWQLSGLSELILWGRCSEGDWDGQSMQYAWMLGLYKTLVEKPCGKRETVRLKGQYQNYKCLVKLSHLLSKIIRISAKQTFYQVTWKHGLCFLGRQMFWKQCVQENIYKTVLAAEWLARLLLIREVTGSNVCP
jgi:hypothetical protein